MTAQKVLSKKHKSLKRNKKKEKTIGKSLKIKTKNYWRVYIDFYSDRNRCHYIVHLQTKKKVTNMELYHQYPISETVQAMMFA